MPRFWPDKGENRAVRKDRPPGWRASGNRRLPGRLPSHSSRRSGEQPCSLVPLPVGWWWCPGALGVVGLRVRVAERLTLLQCGHEGGQRFVELLVGGEFVQQEFAAPLILEWTRLPPFRLDPPLKTPR